jgi:glycosyltransferase involved in cell wall biosynthesis
VLPDAGGHTEVIRQWVTAIDGMRLDQYLISSELQDSTVLGPAALGAVEARTAGVALCPRGLSGSERTRWLARRLLEARPDTLILHIDPADVFALTAVEAIRRHKTFEVYFYNHCDHTFSVGWGLADRAVHFCLETVPHSVLRRGLDPSRARWVPLTVDAATEPPMERAPLGVPGDATLSISAAIFHKIVPDQYWNFGEMLGALIEAEPRHHHLLVGDGLRRHRWHLTRALARRPRGVRSRVHWLGRRPDLPALFGAADFLLDSAPLSGGTIRIQAMAAGLPVVATYHTFNPLFSWTSAFEEDYPLVATSGDELVSLARELIHQPARRREIGHQLAQRHAAQFSPEALRPRLETLLGEDDGPPLRYPPARDFNLQYLAGLAGPVASVPTLLRRARIWLGDPGAGTRDRILRKVDQAIAVLRGVGRS